MNTTVNEKTQRVVFTGNPLDYGNNTFLKFFKEYKVYGVVASVEVQKRHHTPPNYTLVEFSKAFPESSRYFGIQMFELKDVTFLEESAYSESDRLAEVAINVLKAHKTSLPIKCKTEATVSYMDRTFKFEDRQDLETNHSYAMVGTWRDDGKWENIQRQYRPSCCAFTKMTNDLKIWIPKIWLNYYGYTTYDLVEWLKFLSKAVDGFKYEFLGEELLDKDFENSIPEKDLAGGLYEDVGVGVYGSSIYQKGLNGFLALRIKGSQYRMETYMRFICIRYMYNQKYWNIPGHAMQIKRALGAAVTHWEALLLAHLAVDYYGYYCFVNQKSLDPREPGKTTSDPANYFGADMNHDLYVDPYQPQSEVTRKLKEGVQSMNGSFRYLVNRYSRQELDKFFAKSDWKGLYKYTKDKAK